MTVTSKPKYSPVGQVRRITLPRCRRLMPRPGLAAATPRLPPDTPHSMSVTSISSQYRAPHADPTDRNRTARRPRFYAHVWAYAAPDPHVRAAAGSGQALQRPG